MHYRLVGMQSVSGATFGGLTRAWTGPGEMPTQLQLKQCIRKGTINGDFVPVITGTATSRHTPGAKSVFGHTV